MKKFKLFALAVFAMLSTNAFAAVGDVDANTIFRFEITKDYVASPEALGEAKILGFVADYAAVATTTIPATINGATYGGKYKVTAIDGEAFKGKAITTLDLSAAENLTDIGKDAFNGTSITSLDLSATKIATLNQLFENTNTKVTTVSLPKTLTTIGANAFDGLSALSTITFAAQDAGKSYSLTIGAYAFKNTMALTSLTLPANITSIAANAFANTYLTDLTINGDIADGAVLAGAFKQNGSQKIALTYKPSDSAKETAFLANSFASTAKPIYVTLTTTTNFGKKIEATYGSLNGVKLVFDTPSDGQIPVSNQGGKFSYGTWFSKTENITIAKKQGKDKNIDVMVYGAYVDAADETAILMEQMHLINGVYHIPAGTPVIVKSTSDAKVDWNGDVSGLDSRDVNMSTMAPSSEILVYGYDYDPTAADPEPDTYAATLISVYSGYTVIFLKPLDETTFGWAEFTDSRIIKDGQFYLLGPAAPARVIWLDGSEDDQVTAIQNVKTAAKNDGVIYNVAGQKVGASYKGLVIKDGKKYIQK